VYNELRGIQFIDVELNMFMLFHNPRKIYVVGPKNPKLILLNFADKGEKSEMVEMSIDFNIFYISNSRYVILSTITYCLGLLTEQKYFVKNNFPQELKYPCSVYNVMFKQKTPLFDKLNEYLTNKYELSDKNKEEIFKNYTEVCKEITEIAEFEQVLRSYDCTLNNYLYPFIYKSIKNLHPLFFFTILTYANIPPLVLCEVFNSITIFLRENTKDNISAINFASLYELIDRMVQAHTKMDLTKISFESTASISVDDKMVFKDGDSIYTVDILRKYASKFCHFYTKYENHVLYCNDLTGNEYRIDEYIEGVGTGVCASASSDVIMHEDFVFPIKQFDMNSIFNTLDRYNNTFYISEVFGVPCCHDKYENEYYYNREGAPIYVNQNKEVCLFYEYSNDLNDIIYLNKDGSLIDKDLVITPGFKYCLSEIDFHSFGIIKTKTEVLDVGE
jgi:hypothetical protein